MIALGAPHPALLWALAHPPLAMYNWVTLRLRWHVTLVGAYSEYHPLRKQGKGVAAEFLKLPPSGCAALAEFLKASPAGRDQAIKRFL